jgi:phosphoribosylaminoimidazolecarboxamide formyltransferase/IMP cyclohydrolase
LKELRQIYHKTIKDNFPEEVRISFDNQTLVYRKRMWQVNKEKMGLRYGENPNQEAALYELVSGNLILGKCRFISPKTGLVSSLREEDFLQFGKHPSLINLTDVDRGLNILKYLTKRHAAVVIKHNNPCGVAYGNSLAEAFTRAYFSDCIAAFGSCVLLNKEVDKETAELINQSYFEVLAAPSFASGTVDILKKRKNLRIIQIKRLDRLAEYKNMRFLEFKSLMDGGLIVQQSPTTNIESVSDFQLAKTDYKGKIYEIKRGPIQSEANDLLFGWYVQQGLTSNAVIFIKEEATVAIGLGEPDRVGAVEIAIFKAYHKYKDALCLKRHGIPYKMLKDLKEKKAIDAETVKAHGGMKGSAMVSDGFFPFRDGVDVAISEGITAIAQPGGSIRDFEVISACNEASPPIAMVFTGERAFRH